MPPLKSVKTTKYDFQDFIGAESIENVVIIHFYCPQYKDMKARNAGCCGSYLGS
jgi:hypothetical protein